MVYINKYAPRSFCMIALFVVLAITAFPQGRMQRSSSDKKTATIQGLIGGESHDSYMFSASEGQRMTVQITSTGDKADFTVSTSEPFESAEPVKFGKATNKGKRWVGKVPQSGNYYIYVTAHPQARYTLNVTIESVR